MQEENWIYILPSINKYCGLYVWTINSLKKPRKVQHYIYTLNSIKNYTKLFKHISSNSITDNKLILHYTPFYWGPLYREICLIIFLIFVRNFKKKIKINLILHDYIRTYAYSFKTKILVPYFYLFFKIITALANQIFVISEPIGLCKKSLNSNKKVCRIKAYSMFDRSYNYIKEFNIKPLNLLIFGSLQAYGINEIKLLENYIKGLSKHYISINLFLLGTSRNLQNINFKYANCTVIRISHLDSSLKIRELLKKSTLALFFHRKGVTARSGVFSAAIQHGIPIFGLKGMNTEESAKSIKGVFLYKYDDMENAIIDSLELLGNKSMYEETSMALQNFYKENYNWKDFRKSLK